MVTRNINSFKFRLIAIAGLFLILLLIFNLKNYPLLIEGVYSRSFYPNFRGFFQFLFNYIPFSIGDLLYIAIIVAIAIGFFQFVRLLILKDLRRAAYKFLGFILKLEIAIAAFYVFWALNYFRQPALERLNLDTYEYNSAELIAIGSLLIDSANASRSRLNEFDFEVSNDEIIDTAIKAISNLSSFNPPIIAVMPAAKKSLLSPALNYIGTAGYYNPFTGEAQFNSTMPVFTRPFVACHEMAHQMGFGAEDEANFAAFIAGKSSDNTLLKYSAYYLAAQEFMNEVWRTDSVAFKQLKSKFSREVIKDLETEREFWTKYQGAATRLNSVFYDNYLKANNQPGGLKTYNRMIKLSMAYYKKYLGTVKRRPG